MQKACRQEIKKFIHYLKCFRTAIKNMIQPAIKLRPPMGVIAPKTLMPEIASAYKLPENKIMPAESKIADHFK